MVHDEDARDAHEAVERQDVGDDLRRDVAADVAEGHEAVGGGGGEEGLWDAAGVGAGYCGVFVNSWDFALLWNLGSGGEGEGGNGLTT